MIDLIRQYLQDWYLASQSDDPPAWFSTYNGLCPTLRHWAMEHLVYPVQFQKMLYTLEGLFIAEGLNPPTPFNDAALGINYFSETDVRDNPHRMAFVQKHMLPLENSP